MAVKVERNGSNLVKFLMILSTQNTGHNHCDIALN